MLRTDANLSRLAGPLDPTYLVGFVGSVVAAYEKSHKQTQTQRLAVW